MKDNIIDFNKARQMKMEKTKYMESRREKNISIDTDDNALIKFQDKYYFFNVELASEAESLTIEEQEGKYINMSIENYITMEARNLRQMQMKHEDSKAFNVKENIRKILRIKKTIEKGKGKAESVDLKLNFWDLKILSLALIFNLELYIEQFGEKIKDSETYRLINEVSKKIEKTFEMKLEKVAPELYNDHHNG